ncbi:MAG: phage portal protein [Clostridia bacterium]
MLYDMNWLVKGAQFPPATELERMKGYSDHKEMFYGNLDIVFAAYKSRLKAIADKFVVLGYTIGDAEFGVDFNYFQLISTKTMDLLAGDPPTIAGKDVVEDIKKNCKFNQKLRSAICDASRYGDALVRVYKDKNGKGNITLTSPNLWYPIVDRETNEIKQHILCWVEKEGSGYSTKYYLNVQIHDIGRYTKRRFELIDKQSKNAIVLANGLNVSTDTYKIGREIAVLTPIVATGLSDFAIVPLQNFVPSDSVFGISDYDIIVSIIAELQVRYSIEDFVLDKHSAPTPYGPSSAVRQDKNGVSSFNTGGFVEVGATEQPPGYMTWDASFQANHSQIEKLEKHLFTLSQMGAVLNDDAFGASQGFEALEVRMTNAKLKARRMTDDLTDGVGKIISLISEIGYTKVNTDELTIQWNDGLPTSEYRETDIANRKINLLTRKRILKEHFGFTEDDAKEEVDEKREEQAADMASGFSLGIGGGVDGGDNGGEE